MSFRDAGAATEDEGEDLDALRGRVAELEKSLAIARRSANVIAHDLRAPLRTILGFNEALLEDLGEGRTDELVSHARRMERAGQQMTAMLEALLRLARIEHEAHSTGAVDLGAVVSAAVADHARAVQQTGALVSLGDLPVVKGRAPDLRSLFHNLVGNALKHRHDARRPEIRVEAVPRGELIEVRVYDNGRGFAPGELEAALEPFQQLRPGDRREGIGLGLALCADIVASHGGELDGEARPEGGTCFRFTLPALDPDHAIEESLKRGG
ncbi:MAG: HAMP domain-containing sensor histidine kinase [Myxococcota bacterium]